MEAKPELDAKPELETPQKEDRAMNVRIPTSMENLTPGNELFLHHSDHPSHPLTTRLLTGANYESWKKAAEFGLVAKNKLGFVLGTCTQPDKYSPYHNQWVRCNSMRSEETKVAAEADICKRMIDMGSAEAQITSRTMAMEYMMMSGRDEDILLSPKGRSRDIHP